MQNKNHYAKRILTKLKFIIVADIRLRRYLSQAAACDGTMITTTSNDQEVIPGTLPTF